MLKELENSLEAIKQSVAMIGGAGGDGKKGGGHTPTEDSDNLFSESFICVTDLLCEGPIEGVYVSPKFEGLDSTTQLKRSFYLNNVPIINDDNTINYFNYSAYLSDGAQEGAQGIITKVTNIGQPLKYPPSSVPDSSGRPLLGGYNYSIMSPYVKKLFVGIRIGALYRVDKSNGDIHASSVSLNFLINGNVISSQTISGKTSSGYIREFLIPLPEATLDDNSNVNARILTVVKTTPEPTSTSDSQSMSIDYVVEVGNDAFIYPNSVVARAKFSSRYFNQTPKRSYDIKGLKVVVPINYNPLANDSSDQYFGRYAGDWDGAFSVAQWTDNPAWVLYDILTNTRYGLGNYLDVSKIDKWSLYQIGKYCDERVPVVKSDGTTTYEPRFRCNVIIRDRQDSFKLLLQFVSLFRGMVYWGGDTLSFAQDSPKDAVMQFNNSNVTSDGFSYTDIDKNSIYTVALVGYYDADDYFQKKVVYLQNAEGVRKYGIRETEIDAWGCTSKTQAYRLGKWALFSSLYEKEIISFKTGIDVLYLRPCDIIQVMDNDRIVDRRAGRLANISEDRLTLALDSDIYLDSTKSATITLCVPEAQIEISNSSTISRPSQIETRNIVNITTTGNINEITVDSPFSFSGEDLIAKDYVWILETEAVDPAKLYYNNQDDFNTFVLEYLNGQAAYVQDIDLYGYTSKLYRVLNIKEDENGQYELTALQYNPNKYDLIEKDLQSDVDIIPLPTSQVLQPVSQVTVARTISGTTTTLNISWTAPVGFNSASMSYVIKYIYAGSTYNAIVKNNSFQIAGITDPSAVINFTIYPSFDNNTSAAPTPEIVVSVNIAASNSTVSAMSVTNLEIAGQGSDTESTSKDVTISWSFSNPEMINYVAYFDVGIGRNDTSNNLVKFNSPTQILPTDTIGPNVYQATLTYDENSAAPYVPRPSQLPRQIPPYRDLDVVVKAISIYADNPNISSNYREFGSESMIVKNSAPPAYYLNSGVTVSNLAQAFTVGLSNSIVPSDFGGFFLYYSTGSFNPATVINTGNYSSNNPAVQVIDTAYDKGLSVTVPFPAGYTYYGCVVAYDTLGKISLNVPTGLFSGVMTYGITNTAAPSAVNGFVMVPVVEINDLAEQTVFMKMQWNANIETDIDSYDIRLCATGYNNRYYTATKTQTNLYVEAEPNLSYTGVIRAVNRQGNASSFVSGFANTPIISSPVTNAGSNVPVGFIGFYPANNVLSPSGTLFVVCSGQSFPTGSYPDYFNKFGYKYGTVSGGAGFMVPSGRGWNEDILAVTRLV